MSIQVQGDTNQDNILKSQDYVTRQENNRNPSQESTDGVISPFFRRHTLSVTMVIIGVVSFILRIFRIMFKDGKTPVFDEKHYAVQAQEMLLNSSGMENNPNFTLVAHPPLGKWLISVGELFFGYTPLGWRFSSLIAGVTTVLLVCWIVHVFTKNLTCVITAAILMNVEGINISMSRLGMLDIFLGLFSVLIAVFVIEYARHQFNKVELRKSYWLFAIGILGGLMMSVKISGTYYMAACGIALVFATAYVSRDTKKTLKSIAMGLVYFFFIPVSVFFMTYIPWFSNESSVYRHIIESGDAEPVSGTSWLPVSIQNFIRMYADILEFHTNLSTSQDNFHPFESKAIEWFIAARPLLTLSDISISGETSTKMYIFANPAIWYMLSLVFIVSISMVIKRKSAKWGIVLAFCSIGIFPWMAMYERQQYIFYLTTVSPFLVIGITLIIHELSRTSAIHTPLVKCESRYGLTRYTKRGVLSSYQRNIKAFSAVYCAISIAVFLLFIPWLYGFEVQETYHENITNFFPGWGPITEDNVTDVFRINTTETVTETETIVQEVVTETQ